MSDIEKLKREIIEIIEKRYEQRKNKHGWGLLYCKSHILEKSCNDIIFLGINPGDEVENGPEEFAYDDGELEVDYETWYKDEWGSYEAGQAPVQIQVNYLLEILLKCETKNVLSGNLVPFMSFKPENLPHEDWECGREIWTKILNFYIKKHGKVNIIVMGEKTRDSILEIFKNMELELSHINTLPVGSIHFASGSNMESNFYKYSDNIKVCHLPHLSPKPHYWECPILNKDSKDFSSPENRKYYQELEKYIKDFFS